MSEKNGVTYIVTVYNKEKYILNSLESIKKNLFKDLQIIIVNDGSVDKSKERIEKFIKSNPNLDIQFLTQENQGPSIATNNALKFVKFNYIKMLDGDDILSPNSVGLMKKEMETLNLDLLYGDWKWDADYKNYKFKKCDHKARFFKNAFEKILLRGWGGSSNLMVKTNTLKKTNGCDTRVFIQDYSLPLRIAGHHLKSKSINPFRIGLTKKIICVGPKFQENRIITNEAQTLHDLSMVALNFLEDHKFVNENLKIKVLKKIKRRCWKWKSKIQKKSYFSFDFLSFVCSYLWTDKNIEKIKYEIINTWKQENIKNINTNIPQKKILVYVGLDLLGDGIIKIPFLYNLRKIFPNSEITWLAGKGKSTIKEALKPISKELIDFIKDDAGIGSNFSELFFKSKISKNYDIVIDTQKRLLTTLIVRKIKTKLFISPSCNFLVSDIKPNIKQQTKSLAEDLLDLSLLLTYDKNAFTEKIILPALYKKNSKNFDDRYNFKKVAICPGASNEWKRWPKESFSEIANYLIKKNFLPVFFLGPNERNLYKFFKDEIPKALFPLQMESKQKTDPIQTIALSSTCNFGISNDTGCGHLLGISGIPLITLFGRTNEVKFRPFNYFNTNIVISSSSFNKNAEISSIPITIVKNKIDEIIRKNNT